MNRWIEIGLVGAIVAISALYAVYALGPKRIKNTYSRLATKYFGLRAARWFARPDDSDCNRCSANPQTKTKQH